MTTPRQRRHGELAVSVSPPDVDARPRRHALLVGSVDEQRRARDLSDDTGGVEVEVVPGRPGRRELCRQVDQVEPRLSGGRRECGRGRGAVSGATEDVLQGRPGLELETAGVLVKACP